MLMPVPICFLLCGCISINSIWEGQFVYNTPVNVVASMSHYCCCGRANLEIQGMTGRRHVAERAKLRDAIVAGLGMFCRCA